MNPDHTPTLEAERSDPGSQSEMHLYLGSIRIKQITFSGQKHWQNEWYASFLFNFK